MVYRLEIWCSMRKRLLFSLCILFSFVEDWSRMKTPRKHTTIALCIIVQFSAVDNLKKSQQNSNFQCYRCLVKYLPSFNQQNKPYLKDPVFLFSYQLIKTPSSPSCSEDPFVFPGSTTILQAKDCLMSQSNSISSVPHLLSMHLQDSPFPITFNV